MLVVIMGVSGSGKSSVAHALSARTGWPMIEGDDHHPKTNRDKMAQGEPLSDVDRAPWIEALAKAANAIEEGPAILACSALNAFVRSGLGAQIKRPCRWVVLEVPEAELARRLKARTGHFMPTSLLASQLSALDPPEDGIRISATQSVDTICDAVLSELSERQDL